MLSIRFRVASEEAAVSCDENLLSSLGEEMIAPFVMGGRHLLSSLGVARTIGAIGG